MGRRWTKAEFDRVLGALDSTAMTTICKNIGRTESAVRQYAWKHGVKLRQGSFTLMQAAKRSGYSWHAVARARAILDAGIRRRAPGKRHSYWLITEDDFDRICAYLLSDQSKKPIISKEDRKRRRERVLQRNVNLLEKKYPGLKVGGKIHHWLPRQREVRNGVVYWLCDCDCGQTTRWVRQNSITRNLSKSCRKCCSRYIDYATRSTAVDSALPAAPAGIQLGQQDALAAVADAVDVAVPVTGVVQLGDDAVASNDAHPALASTG